MKRRARPPLLSLVGLLGFLAVRPSSAAERACSSLAFSVDAAVRQRWPELDGELHQRFDGRNDIDGCARVGVGLGRPEAAFSVSVTLLDGRSATRVIRHREDLLATVEALVVLPPAAERTDSAPAPSASVDRAGVEAATGAVGAPRASTTELSVMTVHASPPLPASRSRLDLELALALGAQIGDGQTKMGAGATTLADFAGWLAGVVAEVNSYQRRGPAEARTGAFAIGLLGGRRFEIANLTLDVTAGPAVTLRGGWSVATVKGVPDTTVPAVESSSGQTLVPRLRFGSRLTFRPRATVRPFFGIDGEVGRVGPVGPPQRGETQGLPVWTVGLAMGVTVGT